MRTNASRLLWGLPLAAMVAGLLAALWPADEPKSQQRITATPAAARPWYEAATSTPPAAAATPLPAAADALQDLSPEERNALASALALHPARDAEMQRIAGFLRLQRQVEAWRASRAAQGDAIARRELAARIEAALPAALAARSVSAGEALQLQARLIADREPDLARAGAELAAWRTRHVPASHGPDAPEREFLTRQQELVAAYSRQPDKLEPALEALRRKHFTSPN